MTINKAALAAGDRTELLKLARMIRKSAPTDKNAHPMVSQFFDGDPSGVRPLGTEELAQSLAGNQYNDNLDGTQALRDSLHQGDGDLEMFGIKFTKPKTADVSMIGRGPLPRSGWTPAQPVTVSSSEKVLAGKLEKAFSRLSPDQRAALNKAAAPSTTPADTGVLVESLKAICFQLLGCSAETFDANTLKAKIAASVRANPALKARLTKALAAA